jgi:hypothetical protein
VNRHRISFRLRLRANRLDRIAWKLEKKALLLGDQELIAWVKEQRRLAELIRSDAAAVKPQSDQS